MSHHTSWAGRHRAIWSTVIGAAHIRAFQKWSIYGTRPGDYNFGQLARYHRQGTGFVGGGTNFRVSVDVRRCPSRVTMVSPDFPESKSPTFSCRNGELTVTVDRLDYYDVLVLR